MRVLLADVGAPSYPVHCSRTKSTYQTPPATGTSGHLDKSRPCGENKTGEFVGVSECVVGFFTSAIRVESLDGKESTHECVYCLVSSSF